LKPAPDSLPAVGAVPAERDSVRAFFPGMSRGTWSRQSVPSPVGLMSSLDRRIAPGGAGPQAIVRSLRTELAAR
jgi:hypothetical protein